MPSSSSGSSLDPPPLPPPDYTPISTQEWAQKRMPPLKGVIIDPEYPPTAQEALDALAKHNRDFDDEALPYKEGRSSRPADATGKNEEEEVDLYRKSGTSDILGRAATSSEVVNLMPGGTRHTAGGEKMVDVGVLDAVRDVKLADFKGIVAVPCFREAAMYGMVTGFGVGGVLWTLGKRRGVVLNGVLGTTLLASTGLWEWCNYRARRGRRKMRMVKEVWEETRREKRTQWEKLKEKKGEEERSEAQRYWWKVWNTGPVKPRGREG